MKYSASSVDQDNRMGSMKTDYVLIYFKGNSNRAKELKKMKNFKNKLPKNI